MSRVPAARPAEDAEHARRGGDGEVLELMPLGFVELDERLRCILMNRCAEEMSGRRRADVLGKPLREAFPDIENTPLEAAVLAAAHERDSAVLEVHSTATSNWYEVHVHPTIARGVVLFYRDITDRIRAEHAEAERTRVLAETHERASILQAIIDYAPMGIELQRGPDMTYEVVNPAMQAMFPGVDLLGKSSLALWPEVPPSERPPLQVYRDKQPRRNVDVPFLVRHTPDGPLETSYFVTVNVLIPADDPARDAVLSIFFDTTEQVLGRRRIEALAAERARLLEEAERAVRARDVFLAIAAHELKTPLTPLRLDLEATQRALRERRADRLTPERLGRRMDRIDEQVRRLERLVEQMLDIARISAGDLVLEREPMDLSRLAHEAIRRRLADAERLGSPITLDAPGPVEGRWDRARLEQAMFHLLDNALKYGGGAPIDVLVEARDGMARLLIKDRGIGVPLEAQERIFQRFERAASPQHYAGLGLGLWVVREIVHALGGRVSVESAPGAGATFTVELPQEEG